MFLRQAHNYKTDRTYLSIVHGYWDSKAKTSRTKTIRKIGFLDELQKEYPDPIAYFKEVAEKMNYEKETNKVSLDLDLLDELADGDSAKLIGYAPLLKLYHELELDVFFVNRQRNLKIDYNINNIVKLLVFERILNPGSKKRAFENKGKYFENTDFSLDDVYHSLDHINKRRSSCQQWISDRIPNRNTELVYYDVTNYYFEIDEPDELRKKGVSKEHRPNPIIQMGLFIDNEGIPISYNLFPGNVNDCETLIPQIKDLHRNLGIGRVIVVADKGLNTANNCYFNSHTLKNGYIFSQTVRGGHKELKDYVLDEKDYLEYDGGFKIKSRLHPREIELTGASGKKFKKRIDEKQVVFYSPDYDKRAKAERASAVAKAREMAENPTRRKYSYGAAKYLKNLDFDPKSGEILTVKQKPVFDDDKLREEEKWDGYYAIVTSELEKSDDEIIELYRGLWRIEESFKVTKSDLEARPVYVTRETHIQAHFLICFIALVILRLLQKRLGGEFSTTRIVQSLSKAECVHLNENFYSLKFRDDVINALNSHLQIDLTKKFLRLCDIKKIFADAKK